MSRVFYTFFFFFCFAYFTLKNVFSPLPLLSLFRKNAWNISVQPLCLTPDVAISAYSLMSVAIAISFSSYPYTPNCYDIIIFDIDCDINLDSVCHGPRSTHLPF